MTATLLASLLTFVQAAGPGVQSAPARSDYAVGPQDVLAITVFEEPQLSGRFTVDEDGTFAFPLVGRIAAGGLSHRDIETRLTAMLADGFLKNPLVSVGVEQYRSQIVTVTGEVRTPGRYALKGRMTLLDAIVEAGSVTPEAGDTVQLIRRAGAAGAPNGDAHAGAEIKLIDITQLQSGRLSNDWPLRDGDTIVVLRAAQIYVTGHVRSPGAYTPHPGMTVLQAISLAGGFAERGSNRRIKVLRMIGGEKREIDVELTDLIESGDTIIVPKRFF